MITKLSVLALRGISIAARFALSFLFVKYISLEFQGEYSLLITTITLAMMVVGFDFYVYGNRFLIQHKEKENFAIFNQFFFHFATYVLLLAVFTIVRSFSDFDGLLTFTVFFLLILEHLGMEFFRLFIALERPLVANIVLFVRTGTWPVYIIYLMLIKKSIISLDTVINSWIIAAIAAVFLSVIFLWNSLKKIEFKLDKKWIMSGIGIASFFFVSTMAQKGIEFSDRYIINAFLGAKELGIYSFFFQLGNVSNVAIYTMFISFMYPTIITSITQRDENSTKKVIKKLKRSIIGFIGIYAAIIFIFLPFILDIMGKPELNEYKLLLAFFLIGNLFFNLSFTSHYALMAIHKDKVLMVITLIVAVLNLVLNILAVITMGIMGAVIVFYLSAFLLFLIKSNYEKRFFKKFNWEQHD